MSTKDKTESDVSMYDDEPKRLMRYLRNLDFLKRKEPDTVRQILTMINRFAMDQGERKLKSYLELAEQMLDYGVYAKVIEYAEGLTQDPEVLDAFMELNREQSGDPREAIIRDYMETMPKHTLFSPNRTLRDMISFFRQAAPEIRYYIVVDDVSGSLNGIVSVNDFTRNLEAIKTADKDTPVPGLEFFNGNPKVVLSTDKMEYAASLFYEAQQAGKRITKLLVVDGSKRPVGFLAEPDLVRWETVNI